MRTTFHLTKCNFYCPSPTPTLFFHPCQCLMALQLAFKSCRVLAFTPQTGFFFFACVCVLSPSATAYFSLLFLSQHFAQRTQLNLFDLTGKYRNGPLSSKKHTALKCWSSPKIEFELSHMGCLWLLCSLWRPLAALTCAVKRCQLWFAIVHLWSPWFTADGF